MSSGATKDIDWLGPKGLDLHGIKERGNKYIIFVWSVENYVHIDILIEIIYSKNFHCLFSKKYVA